MAFAFKRIDLEDSESLSPSLFSGSIKIGRAQECDYIIPEKEILPIHCEIYHVANDYRFAAPDEAIVQINNADIAEMPATLKDGDIITIGTGKYKFHIIQPLAKRSWKAGFASYLAVLLFTLMIIFEFFIVIWLPYSLGKQKQLDIAGTKQDIYRTIDELRRATEKIPTSDEKTNSTNLKNVLLSVQDEITSYLRKYGDVMNWEQTRTVNRDVYSEMNIITSLDQFKDNYYRKMAIDPKPFINNILNKLEKQASADTEVIQPQ